MTIKTMTASFGKLTGEKITLGAGLNLIHAPNEGGKSTWAAFLKCMLYGIDTRDRDKKGYLADKNRYQPWSGAPMEGSMELNWQGKDITIHRGPKGNTPFGAFSAQYTGTGEPVPLLTGDNCGQIMLGVGREVYERSAFIGQGDSLAINSTPELERRIAALISSGEEDVSFSQTESRLKEWLNRRKVNRSVGLIPKLEGELTQAEDTLQRLSQATADIARCEEEISSLQQEKNLLEGERWAHKRLAQKGLNRRFAQAKEELGTATARLTTLESEQTKYGTLPEKEQLKRAQGELQYLKVLEEEIRYGEIALKGAEDAYVEAAKEALDDNFPGMSGEEGLRKAAEDAAAVTSRLEKSKSLRKRKPLAPVVGLLLGVVAAVIGIQINMTIAIIAGAGLFLLVAVVGILWMNSAAQKEDAGAAQILNRYGVKSVEALSALAEDYSQRDDKACQAAEETKLVRGTLSDRKARRENSRTDLLAFVHTFAPEVNELFGCSAALSRALGLEDRLREANERVTLTRRHYDDLEAQGGKPFDTLEFIRQPQRTTQETETALAAISVRLETAVGNRDVALGRQREMGDPAALAAQKEALDEELFRRNGEHQALTIAMESLRGANAQLRERFSPALNQQAGALMSRLTGSKYQTVTLTRELEGAALAEGAVLSRSALYLSRGTVDQLYLAVRLAVCQLCLPQDEGVPILLDDALAAFDDERMALALTLLEELGANRQILLFSCQSREAVWGEKHPDVTKINLP